MFAFVLFSGLVSAGAAALAPFADSTIGWHDPAVSPDGTRIAAALWGKIWIVPITGGRAEQVTVGTGWDHHPAWSPDGRFLAYSHQRPGRAELVVRTLATGTERTVYATDDDKVVGQIAWRGAEGELLFILETHQFMAHLWSVSLLPDSKAKPITQGSDQAEWSFGVSPDGKRAAVEWVQRGPTDLFLVTIDSAKSTRLTETPGEEWGAEFTRDGNSLVYLLRDNGMERVMIRDCASGTSRSVFESAYDGKQLSLLPDGRSAVLVAGRKLHRLDFGTGKLTPIAAEASLAGVARKPGDLLVTNVRLWDGTGSDPKTGAWVLVKAGRIVEVGAGAPPAAGAGIATIDGGGKFLMSGLIDNHFHYWHAWIFDGARRLAQGITSGRDPGTELAEALNIRDAVRLGVLAAPDMYTTGPIIDGPCGIHPAVDVIVDRAEAGPALVRALKAAGVDAIKVYHCLDPKVLEPVVAEARRLGLPVTGDLGNRTHWDTAIAAGITGLNHAYTYRGAYLPPEYRIFREDDLPQIWTARFRLQGNVPVDPDRPEVDTVLAAMVRRGVALDPTIHIFAVTDSARKALGVEEGARAELRWRSMQRFVKKAVDAGVMLLAGTDANSLNEELEDYETIGVPRSIILQSATVNGAKWLGKEAEFGTVAPGRKGHLLLVDGDPLTSIKDLRKVELVVQNGQIVFRRQ
jgi:imidazolonepropionase-like amidohydrolase